MRRIVALAIQSLWLSSAPPVVEFSAATFGAKGGGKTLATTSIQKAIEAAAARGGVVVFPRGVYLSGALFLKSGVEFRVDKGVELHGVEDDSACTELPSRIGGIEMVCLPLSSMLTARAVSSLRARA